MIAGCKEGIDEVGGSFRVMAGVMCSGCYSDHALVDADEIVQKKP